LSFNELGNLKLIISFSGHFPIFDAGSIFNLTKNDTQTLNKITCGGSIAHFSTALLVATSWFLSTLTMLTGINLRVLKKFLSETHDTDLWIAYQMVKYSTKHAKC
jgi:hypothetical protein